MGSMAGTARYCWIGFRWDDAGALVFRAYKRSRQSTENVSDLEFPYFGHQHLKAEQEHQFGSEVIEAEIESIELDNVIREKCEDALRKVFGSLSESLKSFLNLYAL
jgi:hypothetical protein